MEYVKKSFEFLGKHIIIAVPLLIAVIIPLFFTGMAMNILMQQIPQIIQTMMNQGGSGDPMENVQYLLSVLQNAGGNSALGGFFGIVLALLAYPIVTGLIKNGLAGEETGFDKFVDALKENFIQYLLFIVGCIIVAIIAAVGLLIAGLILGIILGLLGSVGSILGVLIFIAAFVFGIYFGIRLFSLWLPAMIIDRAGIFEGLKKGFEATKGSFWLIFLVSLLVGIATMVLQLILGFLGGITFIGPIIMGTISAASAFLLLIFTMIVYKEKSAGAATEPASDVGPE